MKMDKVAKNKTFRKMYHATPNKLESLDRSVEIYLAPDISIAKTTAALGGSPDLSQFYVYEVYYPLALKIFNPRSIFRDTEEAQEITSFLDLYLDGLYEYEDLEDYNFDVSFAIQYFKDRANYTDEGFEILKSCGENLAIEQIMETFVMLYPSTKILGRNNSCLLSFGYQGRFEQETELNAWVEIEDCSVCVFDQRLCTLGDLTQSPNTRQNPKGDTFESSKETIKFVNFMSPFANELLHKALVDDLEYTQADASDAVCDVLGSKSQKERVIDWVDLGFKRVLKILKSQNRATRLLKESVRQYLDIFKKSGMPRGTLKLATEICNGNIKKAIKEFDSKIKVDLFESYVLTRIGSYSFELAGEYRIYKETKDSQYTLLYLQTPASSVAYILYTYLISYLTKGYQKRSNETENTYDVEIGDCIYVKYVFPYSLNKSEFDYDAVKSHTFTVNLVDVLYEHLYHDTENVRKVTDFDGPMWMFQIPQKIRIDILDLHLSRFESQDYLKITPSTFKSKIADYTNAPFVSSSRSNAKLVTRSKNPRAVCFSWNLDTFCRLIEDGRSYDLNRVLNFFGMGGIFIKATFGLDCLFTSDMDLQTLTLLSDVVDTIPFTQYPKNYSMRESVLAFNYDPKTQRMIELGNVFPTNYLDAVVQNMCIFGEVLESGEVQSFTNTVALDLTTDDVRNALLLYLWFADSEGLDTSFAKDENNYALEDLMDAKSQMEISQLFGAEYADLTTLIYSQLNDKTLRLPMPRQCELIECRPFTIKIVYGDEIQFIPPLQNYVPTIVRPIIAFEVDSNYYVFADPQFLRDSFNDSDDIFIAIYMIEED